MVRAMRTWASGMLLGLGCVPAAAAQQDERESLQTMLHRLLDQDWLYWRAPPAGERCVQFSSADPRSRKGAAYREDWYANDDRGHYLRVVERDGVREHVLVDVDGPGCLVRLWSANPSGTLHFDIDGQRVWSVDFAELCNGRVDGVPPPFAAMRSRGGNVHLPVPFAQRLSVSATAGDLYYLADVARFAPATTVQSFAPEQLVAEQDLLQQMVPSHLRHGYSAGTRRAHAERVEVPAGKVVKGLFLEVRERRDGVDLGKCLQAVRLVVHAGEERTIDVPVPDFFGSTNWRDWRSFPLGIMPANATGSGEPRSGYCLYPMPMPAGGTFELVADAEVDDVDLLLDVRYDDAFGKEPLLFRASYNLAKGIPTRPFTDHVVLDATGTGRFVGCSLLVRNPSRIWWGEGDEKVWVDGETFPTWFGTGTEDYFGFAWCDPTPFQAPFHAQIECQGPQNFGFTQLHRTHLLDSIPFRKALRFEFERWHWVETARMDYATVAYWYGATGAKSGLPPVPPADERVLVRLDQPPMWIAEGALEAEDLRVVACSGGAEHAQDMGQFERAFSRDGMRWWRDGKPGDRLVLAVPIAAAGRYRVTAGFAQADTAGRVQVTFGGRALGPPFDGFAAARQPSGPVVLGSVELAAGQPELVLELLPANERAQPGNHIGLDYLRLEPLP